MAGLDCVIIVYSGFVTCLGKYPRGFNTVDNFLESAWAALFDILEAEISLASLLTPVTAKNAISKVGIALELENKLSNFTIYFIEIGNGV